MAKHGTHSKKHGSGTVDAPMRPSMGRVKLAMVAIAMVAMGGSVALVRACERKAGPIEDDAAAPSSCSDDAAMCVARA